MTVGLPVIATDIPGNRDLVVPGETGFLVGVGDAAGFARCAHQLFDDGALMERMGQAALERVRQSFSVEQMVEQHANLYRELLAA